MEKQKNKKTWIIIAVLAVICIVQGIIILKQSHHKSPDVQLFDDVNKFSSFLNDKFKKETDESFDLYNRFFDDDFFAKKPNPFEEMERIHRRLEKMMDIDSRKIFNNTWESWFNNQFFGTKHQVDIDMKEKSDAYIYIIRIPHLNKNNLKINIDKNSIAIDGEFSRNLVRKDSKGNIIARHEMHQTLSRRIPIPEGTDYANAKVENKKDKIIIRLPKIKPRV